MNFANISSDIGGIGSEQEADWKFQKVFGNAGVVPGQTYYDPVNKVDLRPQMYKALSEKGLISKGPSIGHTSGGTYTSYGLMPSFLDPEIVDQTMYETPLVFWIKRKAVRGRSYVYNLISAKGGAQWLGDDAPLSSQVDTRTTTSVAMKFLYAVGRVTGPALAGGSGYINLLAEDLRVKTASMNEALENEIINGNTTTNALGFQGLIQSITTNTTNKAGAYVTLENMRTELATCYNARGKTDLILTDASTHNYAKGLLMDYQRFIERPAEGMPFGIPGSFIFDGVTVIRDQYMPTTASAKRMMFLDSRYLFLAVLQDITYEELAKNNDSSKFYVKWYGALCVTYEGCMSQIYGIL